MTFRIVRTSAGKARIEADARLVPDDFHAIARQLNTPPVRARSVGCVAAQRAAEPTVVETRWNGRETINTARKGDWIVTSLSSSGRVLRDSEGHENRYVITADRFEKLYVAEANVFRATGVVTALEVDGGFDIMAPWGERQKANAGYLVLNDTEVYGNNADTFKETHELIS